MDTSLIINATQNGKKVTKAITNINPEKDNATLKTFAQKVNALTTNNYVDATRVNKMSVEEADAGGGSTGELTFTVTHYPHEAVLQGGGLSYIGYETIEGGVRLTFEGDSEVEDYYIDVTAQ